MRKYTTLLFDADNTLLDFYAAEKQAIEMTCRAFGIEYNEKIGKIYSDINDGFWKRFEKGEIKREEIKIGRFVDFIKFLNLSIDAKEMSERYIEELSQGRMLLDGALGLCRKLSKQYTMYIVTNGNSYVQKSRFSGSCLEPFFEKVFISEDMGSKKPDKEYFDKVFEQIAEKQKSKILIIGDSMSSDILGGINAGIDTCFFNVSGKEKYYEPTYEVQSFKELEELLYE